MTINNGNDTEKHRRECEARFVMNLPRDQRQAHYEGVLKNRKQKGLDELLAEVKRQRELQNEQCAEM